MAVPTPKRKTFKTNAHRNWQSRLAWTGLLMLLGPVFLAQSTQAEPEISELALGHVHGVSHLHIVVQGNRLVMQIVAPGADIMGAERETKDSIYFKNLTAAKKQLGDPMALFNLPQEAGCKTAFTHIEYLPVDIENLMQDPATPDALASNKVRKLTKDARQDLKRGIRGGFSNAAPAQVIDDFHAEFRTFYTLNCEDLEKLKTLQTNYFKLFPHAKTLIVRLVSELLENRIDLTPKRPVIAF